MSVCNPYKDDLRRRKLIGGTPSKFIEENRKYYYVGMGPLDIINGQHWPEKIRLEVKENG